MGIVRCTRVESSGGGVMEKKVELGGSVDRGASRKKLTEFFGKVGLLLLVINCIGLLLMMSSREAHAGLKLNWPVNVSFHHADGAMGNTRNTADTTQYLYCSLHIISNFGTYMNCAAKNAAGATASCMKQLDPYNPEDTPWFAAISGMTGDAWISFDADSIGTCINLTTENGSPEPAKSQ